MGHSEQRYIIPEQSSTKSPMAEEQIGRLCQLLQPKWLPSNALIFWRRKLGLQMKSAPYSACTSISFFVEVYKQKDLQVTNTLWDIKMLFVKKKKYGTNLSWLALEMAVLAKSPYATRRSPRKGSLLSTDAAIGHIHQQCSVRKCHERGQCSILSKCNQHPGACTDYKKVTYWLLTRKRQTMKIFFQDTRLKKMTCPGKPWHMVSLS